MFGTVISRRLHTRVVPAERRSAVPDASAHLALGMPDSELRPRRDLFVAKSLPGAAQPVRLLHTQPEEKLKSEKLKGNSGVH